MTESIIQLDKACFICESPYIQVHHCIHGHGRRKLADKDGLVVYLCPAHHTGANGVHNNPNLDKFFKTLAQETWQRHFGKSKDDFISRYGKNYL